MNSLAIVLCAILILTALLHLLWALGSSFPCKDKQTLARAVVGTRGIERMPPRWASLFVSVCLMGASVWALALRDIGPVDVPNVLSFFGGAALTTIFGLRGIAGILPAFERMSPEQPFLSLNRRFYSPLCIAVGIGFGLLTISIPNWSWWILGVSR